MIDQSRSSTPAHFAGEPTSCAAISRSGVVGTRPNAFGGWTILEVDVPIYIPGHITHYVRVAPGDYIFGDNDGVQVIPKAYIDEVLLRVEYIFDLENKEREQLAAGMPIDEVYRVFGVL